MWVLHILLIVVAGEFVLQLVFGVAPHFFTPRDRGGDLGRGLVIFVEPIRWLGVRWGARTTAAGLRRAGFEGEFRLWEWHSSLQGTLVLPVIMSPKLLEAEAQRLAEFIANYRREHPDRRLHVIGYSSGGFVAVRAMELLAEGVQIDGAAVLGGAFSPGRDLSQAAGRVTGKLVICSSLGDWPIVGLGTLIFGTADRKHTLSVGMIGLRGESAFLENVVQLQWTPSMLRLGHLGGHFSAANRGFITHHLAPAMSIGPT